MRGMKMDIKMEVDKIFASIGDEIKYSIMITNEQNIPLKEIWLIDELPIGITFIEKSIEVDGYPVGGVINKGIPLGILMEGERKYITFKCRVSKLPQYNPVINTADVYFVETVGEKRIEVPSTGVVTVITDPDISQLSGSFELFVDKEMVSYKDGLNYTIRLTNQGNCKAENISIKNLVPIQTALQVESLSGSSACRLDRENNFIYIEELDIGEQITITYGVDILQEVRQYDISHQVSLAYEFVGPDRRRVYKQYVSPQVFSVICLACFNENLGGFIKLADASWHTVGDEINYVMKLTNNGNVTATHLKLRDSLAKGVDLIPKSLMIDGVSYNEKGSLEEGISLPDLRSYEKIEIRYQGKVRDDVRYEEALKSQAYITYAYVVGEAFVIGEDYSNSLETNVGVGLIDEEAFTLVADKQVATLKDEVSYRIRLRNKGNINISSMAIVCNRPAGTRVRGEGWEEQEGEAHFHMIQGLRPGEVFDIHYPIEIEDIDALGEIQGECRLYYSYRIGERLIEKSLSSIQEEPVNVVVARLQSEDGGIIKSVSKMCVVLNELIAYTTVLTNTGNVTAKDVILQRILTGYKVEADVKAIRVGDIAPHETRMVTYDLLVEELPALGYIGSRDEMAYSYEVGDQILSAIGVSEEIITVVEEACLLGEEGEIRQNVDRVKAKPEDILTYTLALRNRGNIPAEEIVLTLPILEEGEWLGERKLLRPQIEVGGMYYFTYTLKVNAHAMSEKVICTPQVDYVFYTSTGEKQYRSYTLNPVETQICQAKLTTVRGDGMGSVDKEYVTLGDEISCKIQLVNQGNILAKGVCIWPQKVAGIEIDQTVLDLGDIKPGEGVEASYTVRVIAYQDTLTLLSELAYTYDLEEGNQVEKVTVKERIQTKPIIIKLAQLAMKKWIDKIELIAHERINYELVCSNEGNIDAVNVRIEECLPEGMCLCQETISVEGEVGYSLLDKQTIGIAKIRPEERIKVCFEVEVTSDHVAEEIVEETRLNYDVMIDPSKPLRQMYLLPIVTKLHLIEPKVEMRLIGERERGLIGDILDYKIEITNTGNIVAEDIIIGIEITEGVESIAQPVEEMRILLLNKGETKVLDFKLEIKDRSLTEKLSISPFVKYRYKTETEIGEKTQKIKTIILGIEEIKVEINKTSDKDYLKVGVGDEISYHIQMTNTGTLSLDQIILYDEISTNTYFIEGSLSVNGLLISTANIGYGINLGEMRIGQMLVVDYKVRVSEYYSKFIESKAYIEYAVRREDNGVAIKGQTPLDHHKMRMLTPRLAMLCYRNTLTLPYQYLDVDKILDFKVEALIIQENIENTNRLSIQGQLKYSLVYSNREKVKQNIEWIKLFVEKIEVVGYAQMEHMLQASIEREHIGIINNRQIESTVEVGISEN